MASYGVPPQRSRGPIVLVGVLVLVLIVVLAVGAVVLVRRANEPDPPAIASKPASADALQFRRVLKASPGGCDSASPAASPSVCGLDGYTYVLGKVELDGSHVSEVKAAQAPETTGWLVNLTLDDSGAQLFAKLTGDLATQQMPLNQLAIVVRNQVVAAPAVQSAIPGGKLQITGNYSQKDAEKLAGQITG
ncbi:SecDF P1 head subdomain-containing protein [Kribbella sp. NPDC050124]|uniref:SecDF P1 head subdomain-containing protein n=1 Tax=Kribbella sp. NPDC050124 TaxID=3364114 RepID=UPI0037BD9E3E